MIENIQRRLITHLPRLLRFGLVGGSGIVVNYTLLYLLVERAGMHYLPASAVATEASILSNFMLNDRWTFRDVAGNGRRLGRAARYNLIAGGGLLLSVAVLGLLTGLLNLHYLLANLFAIGVATLWNYVANWRWTWTGTTVEEETPAVDPVLLTTASLPCAEERVAGRRAVASGIAAPYDPTVGDSRPTVRTNNRG